MASRRYFLAGMLAGGATAGVTTVIANDLTDFDEPEVDAGFTGISGSVRNPTLLGEIEVKAGSETTEVIGHINDSYQVENETLDPEESETYELELEVQNLDGNHEIVGQATSGGRQFRDEEALSNNIEFHESGGDPNSGGESEEQDNSLCQLYDQQSSKAKTQFRQFLNNYDGLEDLEPVSIAQQEVNGVDRYFWDDDAQDILVLLDGKSGKPDELPMDSSFARELYELDNKSGSQLEDSVYGILDGEC